MVMEIHDLTTFYNTDTGETEEIAMFAHVFNLNKFSYASAIHDGNPDPKTK
jgi:hypothetical protein